MRTKDAKDDPRAAACIEEILVVCKKHGFALSHEDGHGAFILVEGEPDSADEEWLRAAYLETSG